MSIILLTFLILLLTLVILPAKLVFAMKKHIDSCPSCSAPLEITQYTCPVCSTRVEGNFQGCDFCSLSDDDRLFTIVFLQTEGNMKDVERLMGISYPTVKARLAKLNAALSADIPLKPMATQVAPEQVKSDAVERIRVLDRLKAGEITAAEAVRLIKNSNPETSKDEI
jgi:hypothetical protein